MVKEGEGGTLSEQDRLVESARDRLNKFRSERVDNEESEVREMMQRRGFIDNNMASPARCPVTPQPFTPQQSTPHQTPFFSPAFSPCEPYTPREQLTPRSAPGRGLTGYRRPTDGPNGSAPTDTEQQQQGTPSRQQPSTPREGSTGPLWREMQLVHGQAASERLQWERDRNQRLVDEAQQRSDRLVSEAQQQSDRLVQEARIELSQQQPSYAVKTKQLEEALQEQKRVEDEHHAVIQQMHGEHVQAMESAALAAAECYETELSGVKQQMEAHRRLLIVSHSEEQTQLKEEHNQQLQAAFCAHDEHSQLLEAQRIQLAEGSLAAEQFTQALEQQQQQLEAAREQQQVEIEEMKQQLQAEHVQAMQKAALAAAECYAEELEERCVRCLVLFCVCSNHRAALWLARRFHPNAALSHAVHMVLSDTGTLFLTHWCSVLSHWCSLTLVLCLSHWCFLVG